MNTLVVYESHWGNTASVARAIAEGLGPGARALTTDEASDEAITDADLIVAGAPVIAFRLATDKMRDGLVEQSAKAPAPADTSHPSMRAWLGRLPRGQGRAAAFETRIWWSPRGATGDIERGLKGAGFSPLAKAQRFIVEGTYGPLREGELERARAWGTELAEAMRSEMNIPVGAAG
jgi:flavorubredoxin